MRRREFITLVGSAVAAWPLGARAQQGAVRRIGVLDPNAEDDAETKVQLAGFRDGLAKLGWVEGRTIHIDYRFVAGNADQWIVSI